MLICAIEILNIIIIIIIITLSVPAFLHVETAMSRVGVWTDPLHI